MPDVLRTPLRKERQLWSLQRNSRHACSQSRKGFFRGRNLSSSQGICRRQHDFACVARSEARLNANRLGGRFWRWWSFLWSAWTSEKGRVPSAISGGREKMRSRICPWTLWRQELPSNKRIRYRSGISPPAW